MCNLDWFKLILELEPIRIRSLTHSRIRRPSTLDPRPRSSTRSTQELCDYGMDVF